MTIADHLAKGKPFLIYLAIFLAITAGIGIGILIAEEQGIHKDQLWIEQLPAEERQNGAITATTTTDIPKNQQAAAAAALPYEGKVYASKTGTTYYTPSCTSRIKPENRVTYQSRAAAEAAGLKPSKTCKAL